MCHISAKSYNPRLNCWWFDKFFRLVFHWTIFTCLFLRVGAHNPRPTANSGRHMAIIGAPSLHFRLHKRCFISKQERMKVDWGRKSRHLLTPSKIYGRDRRNVWANFQDQPIYTLGRVTARLGDKIQFGRHFGAVRCLGFDQNWILTIASSGYPCFTRLPKFSKTHNPRLNYWRFN